VSSPDGIAPDSTSARTPGGVLLLVLIGGIGGVLSGAFGVGGGIVMVPLLITLLAGYRDIGKGSAQLALVAGIRMILRRFNPSNYRDERPSVFDEFSQPAR